MTTSFRFTSGLNWRLNRIVLLTWRWLLVILNKLVVIKSFWDNHWGNRLFWIIRILVRLLLANTFINWSFIDPFFCVVIIRLFIVLYRWRHIPNLCALPNKLLFSCHWRVKALKNCSTLSFHTINLDNFYIVLIITDLLLDWWLNSSNCCLRSFHTLVLF
jgi:hypothetical protein